MKTLPAVIAALCLCVSGCGNTQWSLSNEPTTDAERKAVAEHVEHVLAATPSHLGGSSQRWPDAIAAAQKEACLTLCRPTLWEYQQDGFLGTWGRTGHWKYVDAAETTKP